MQLSVVILNYNVRYFLEQCLLSVQQATSKLDAEIIVIDNASADDSCQMVKERFPQVTLIENTDNVGFSKANNQAVAIAKGEYLCILNPDTAVPHHAFEQCLAFADAHPDMGGLGIHYMDGTGNFLPESKRNLPTPGRSLMKLLGFTKGKYGYYAKHLSPTETGKVAILAGAFLFVKKSVYDAVGGFDEDYFMYGEDIDLSYKFTKAGYQNYYKGDLKFLHYKGESTQKDKAYLDRFYGAMQIFYQKHFNTNVLLKSFVNLGVGVTKFWRELRLKKQQPEKLVLTEALVITQDLGVLKQLSEQLEIPVRSVALRIVEEDVHQQKMLIFDAAFVSYERIFDIMKLQRGQGNSFRIKPPGCTYLLGSDLSDAKGEVVVL